ncbi:MAG: type II toxin-antitoxin system Phd/YefM family antitoxin [Pelomonas sp.]|nr:type II toxin-antitoxin system Phd/YefM family antitoxin [Roseateles sp.]
MSDSTISAREFNQDLAGAKKAAERGPVVITDRGRPSHVLMSYARYLELAGRGANIVSLLAMPEAAELEFEPAPLAAPYRAAALDD